MKKFICVLLTLVMAATFCLVNVGAEYEIIVGDVDYDGKFTETDVFVLREVVYRENYRNNITDEGFIAADLNSDGVVDVRDLILMRYHFYGFGAERPSMPNTSDGKISVSSTNYVKGSGQFELIVTAEDLPNVAALDLELSSVTSGLMFVGIEDLSGSLQETHDDYYSYYYPIPVAFLSANGMNKDFNGPLCKLIFDVSEDVYNGEELDINISASNRYGGTIQVEDELVGDAFTKMTPVDYSTQGGTVTVVEPPTDTECALEILEYLVGRLGEIGDSADYNGDGEVDIKDALWLLKRLVGIEV